MTTQGRAGRPAADSTAPSTDDPGPAWFYWGVKWMFGRPLIRTLFRPVVIGAELIPEEGPIILAANHVDAGETVLGPAMLRRRMTFPAKRELFEGRRPADLIRSVFLRLIRQVPLDRSGGQASADGMGEVGRVLSRGDVLAMFPEGTRSPDGRLYKGHTGLARLALQFDVPVIPIGMVNTQLVRGPFGLPWYRHPKIVVGAPLRFSPYAGRSSNRDVLRYVTDEVMNAIMELTGQTYVDMYGAGAKQALARGESLDHRILPRPGYGRVAPEAAA